MKRVASDEGASAVEFALVLPILAVVVFGIIQFGLAFAQVLALNSAARQGARVGVTGAVTCSQVDAASRSASKTVGIGDSQALAPPAGVLTVTLQSNPTDSSLTSGALCATSSKPCAGQRGNPFRVTVSKPFGIALPFAFISPSVQLRGKGEYRCESNVVSIINFIIKPLTKSG